MEIEKINDTELAVKVYQSFRLVTFKDIDTVHQRPEGTARKRFNDNKKHFIEGEDYFVRKTDEAQKEFGIAAPNVLTPLTESGYLMLVKSFTDDLAWDVQRKLVKSYFRKTHNVKQLTITSRDIARIIGKHHPTVLTIIRDCIKELSDMGFNITEFFQQSTYHGGNNQEILQYLCTEKGCDYFSGHSEPDIRKMFIADFKGRFERMWNVVDGKPVSDVTNKNLIGTADMPEQEPVIRLFESNTGSVLLIDNDVYGLMPEETETVRRLIPELEKNGVNQIKKVLIAILESGTKSGKLTEITSWRLENEETEPEKPDLFEKFMVCLQF